MKIVYCIICERENDITIESAWTSKKKADKRVEELRRKEIEVHGSVYYHCVTVKIST